ncbi:hypothetical protein BEP19_09500 [Ammoniphilus oxalaticus]|uniref:Recombinase domain-containing protein n=1 Tax=Ammoniphilus oxalaticus TaxID=66863 RepID=A0A419SKU4_9BACL|nr:recombinase family protein [Ammoniphilus oxalaticus]RKD24602.1 hypothetical protein BEP19_09500 [Ammoniphilus oxalaticus]
MWKNEGHMKINLYGYKCNNGQALIEKEEAKVVRKIFQLRSEGMEYSLISRHLNESGYIMDRGRAFTAQRVSIILQNVFYVGFVEFADIKTKEFQLVKGTHLPIITKDIWNEVQKVEHKQKLQNKDN